jgi:hypothetical protein
MKLKALVTLGLVAALAGCGNLRLGPAADVFSNIEPGIGFEVTEQGIVVVNPTISFRARAGSVGVTVNRYSAEFIDSSGNPIYPADPKTEGAIGVYVPPGITCDAPTDDGCTSFSKGAAFGVGPESRSVAFGVMQGQYAIEMLTRLEAGQTANNWRARITFHGTADNGVPVQWTEFEPVVYPLGAE